MSASAPRSPRSDAAPRVRQSWSYFAAPLGVYLIVMAPICALEAFLIANRSPTWMKVSAGVVVAFSLYGLFRGYLRRLVLTEHSVALCGPFRRIEIAWGDVRSIGVYVPGGGVGAVEYVYFSTHDRRPLGKWEIDSRTLQVQNRPGLLDALGAYSPLPIQRHSGAPLEVS